MIFRRKAARDEAQSAPEADVAVELDSSRPRGPWDRSETTVDQGDASYVDLGGLLVKGSPGLELRLQVDEAQSTVSAVLLAGPRSGLELRAFAAPRHEGIWDDVRRDIAAEAVKRGGSATEQEGEFGVEVLVVVPAQAPDGRQTKQTSRIVGVEGPRWMLRGTFLGESASVADPEGVVESAFRDVIVVRGDGPMSPREMLRMQMPAHADPEAGHEHDDDSGAAGSDDAVS